MLVLLLRIRALAGGGGGADAAAVSQHGLELSKNNWLCLIVLQQQMEQKTEAEN